MKILALACFPCVLSAQTLILRAHAHGDQIYTCQLNGYTLSWALKAPDAQLLDDSGRVIGRHFAGPSWQLTDGSEVVGRPTGHTDSPEKNAVPWLTLAVVSETGHGRLEHTSTIKGVNTHGGQAPPGGCDSSHVGQDTRVPYTADYEFYGN